MVRLPSLGGRRNIAMAVRSNFLVDALLALENRVCLKARLKGHSQYRFIAIPTARVRNQIFFGYIGTDKSRRVSGDADCGGSAYIGSPSARSFLSSLSFRYPT